MNMSVLKITLACALSASFSFSLAQQAAVPAMPTVQPASFVSKVFEPWLKKSSFKVKYHPRADASMKIYDMYPENGGSSGYTMFWGDNPKDICSRGKIPTRFSIDASGALVMQFNHTSPNMCPTYKYVFNPQSAIGESFVVNQSGDWELRAATKVELLGYDPSEYQKELSTNLPGK